MKWCPVLATVLQFILLPIESVLYTISPECKANVTLHHFLSFIKSKTKNGQASKY